MRNLRLWLELRRWRRAGRTARLWWRDDDAAGGSAALDRLLQASRAADAPLTLAVVPDGDMATLAGRLARTGLVSVVQHGVDHRNRRTGPAAGEFPHDWTQEDLEGVLRRGWSLMRSLPRAHAVFVPPWNDIHPRLEVALVACGYLGWSVSGALQSGVADDLGVGLPRADVHLDLLRWRGGVRFRGAGRFLDTLARELARRRRAGLWDDPIGILTHHLVHDGAAWTFLEAFLGWAGRRPELAWTTLAELTGEARGGLRQAAAA